VTDKCNRKVNPHGGGSDRRGKATGFGSSTPRAVASAIGGGARVGGPTDGTPPMDGETQPVGSFIVKLMVKQRKLIWDVINSFPPP